MALLNTLANIRTPALTSIASFFTFFGEETFLIIIAMIVLWCFDRKKGYRLLMIALLGLAINGLIKTVCAVPRPWVIQPGISVASAIEKATGYSFPSGHTQIAVMVSLTLASFTKKKWPWILGAFFAALVGFSRMMLGVHTPADVIVGYLLGIAVVLGSNYLLDHTGAAGKYALAGAAVLITVVAILYTSFGPRSSTVMDESDLSGCKDMWTILGVLVSLCAGWFFDEKHHASEDQKAVWWVQVLKTVVGFALVMAIRLALKSILPDAPWSSAVRYLFIGVMIIIVWPGTFPWWNRLCKTDQGTKRV